MAENPLRVLSLATGIGGLDRGFRMAIPDSRVVCCVEHEAYATAVLEARMDEGRLDDCPIWSNIATFRGSPWRGLVEVVLAGFPCQPVSVAGDRKGPADDRWIWPDIARIIREVEPPVVFLENVAGLMGAGWRDVARDLIEMGFDCSWDIFACAELGAPHVRERIFVLAIREGWAEILADAQSERTGPADLDAQDADRDGQGVGPGSWPPGPDQWDEWGQWIARGLPGPGVCRDADESAEGLVEPSRQEREDRARVIGNSCSPPQAAFAFTELLRVHKITNGPPAQLPA